MSVGRAAFGITHANVVGGGTPAVARTLGAAAEAAGIESIWAVDHVVWPTRFTSSYPYAPAGALPPSTTDAPFPEPLTWLTFVAAATTRLRLATGVLVLPQREPLLLAKQTATLDVLSEGRLLLGVGIGWLREEFAMLGASWEDRARRTEEYVRAMRAAWRDHPASFAGETIAFEAVKLSPRPRAGAVPIVFGGGPPAARRAGRLGDGYYAAPDAPPDQLRTLFALVDEEAERAGRDPSTIERTARGDLDAASIEPLLELGVDRILVGTAGADPFDLAAAQDRIARLGAEVIPTYG